MKFAHKLLVMALASSMVATATAVSTTNDLAMMIQVVQQFKNCVDSKNLDGLHNEDAIIGVAVNELLAHPDGVASNQLASFKADLTTLSQQSGDLHQAGDMGQLADAEKALSAVTTALDKVKNYFPSNVAAAAEARADRYMCPMHHDVIGKSTDVCPKCGMQLDQMVRILPASFATPESQSIRASVKTDSPLTIGKPVTVTLKLQRPNGDPVFLSDLIETHTKKIHLLIADHSLTDYHHEHPQPTDIPGEYVFTFTPHKPGPYRVWADLRPYPLGLQEYVIADIPATTKPLPLTNRKVSYKASADGLNYELFLDQKQIYVGKPVHARLLITTPDGKGFNQLEPIMATFAHIVGFSEDYETVLHIHPKGKPILDPNARGGPELEFQIYALKPGFVRLFSQVQIGGRSHFAPFGIMVEP